MTIRILQINLDKDDEAVAFETYGWLERNGKRIDIDIYDSVFLGKVNAKRVKDEDILEEIFQMFNAYKPDFLEMRSLSVSDIVILYEDTPGVSQRWYYCDLIGFKRIIFQRINADILYAASTEDDQEDKE